MDLTEEQIENEFRRQVKLCSGIGHAKQLKILREFWKKQNPESWMVELLKIMEDYRSTGREE